MPHIQYILDILCTYYNDVDYSIQSELLAWHEIVFAASSTTDPCKSGRNCSSLLIEFLYRVHTSSNMTTNDPIVRLYYNSLHRYSDVGDACLWLEHNICPLFEMWFLLVQNHFTGRIWIRMTTNRNVDHLCIVFGHWVNGLCHWNQCYDKQMYIF